MPRLAEAFPLSRRARRCWLAALARVVLITQAAGFAHFLLVRHAVCPEHGELIHAAEGAETTSRDVENESRSTGVAVRGGDGFTHEHAHCTVATHRRQATAVPAAEVTLVVAPPATGMVVAFVNATRTTADALYRLAPKTSPPA